MKPIRIIVLAVAVVAALALALLVRNVMSGKPTSQASAAAPVKPSTPMAQVLVAARDLKIGDRLTPEDMTWQAWPVDAVNPAFTTDGATPLPQAKVEAKADPKDASAKDKAAADAKNAKNAKTNDAVAKVSRTVAELSDGGPKAAFVGAVVREPLLKGEPVVDRKLVRSGQSGYMAVVLQPGMRAMAVPMKVESAAGGFILPGDRVDILLSRDVEMNAGGEGGNSRSVKVSETVLQNIKILAIDQTTQTGKDETTVVGATATVEVTPADAEALALAKVQGELSLTLRSYADIDQPSGRVARQVRVADAAAAGSSVRVFRNGSATAVQVNP